MLIRENTEAYMQELKKWISETADTPPEEMKAFFSSRLSDYEEHMSQWKTAYRRFAECFPASCGNVLDLGCGTGLELDEIYKAYPNLEVIGVDLNEDMLKKCAEKYKGRNLKLVCEDYLRYDMLENEWDCIISFQSLHHFLPEIKLDLYRKIHAALKPRAVFLSGDYIACCPEEEALLNDVYLKKREKFGIPAEKSIHSDIPLTVERETQLMRKAGFSNVSVLDSIDGTTIIRAEKGAK